MLLDFRKYCVAALGPANAKLQARTAAGISAIMLLDAGRVVLIDTEWDMDLVLCSVSRNRQHASCHGRASGTEATDHLD